MTNINLDELLAQRAEATGSEEGRIPFQFTAKSGPNKGKTERFTFRDPLTLTADEQEELNDLRFDDEATLDDVAEFWMGEDEYIRFTEAGGTALAFNLVVEENHARTQGVDSQGRPTRQNRSSRRKAARAQKR